MRKLIEHPMTDEPRPMHAPLYTCMYTHDRWTHHQHQARARSFPTYLATACTGGRRRRRLAGTRRRRKGSGARPSGRTQTPAAPPPAAPARRAAPARARPPPPAPAPRPRPPAPPRSPAARTPRRRRGGSAVPASRPCRCSCRRQLARSSSASRSWCRAAGVGYVASCARASSRRQTTETGPIRGALRWELLTGSASS